MIKKGEKKNKRYNIVLQSKSSETYSRKNFPLLGKSSGNPRKNLNPWREQE